MTARFLIAASLALGANAHMFISSPSPIAGNAVKPPLDPSGSDFPCHGMQLPTSGGQKMAAGSSQLLAFDLGGGANTAVHGGGSCQLSFTQETNPAKQKDPKNWKVVYSILGGCMSTSEGNLEQAVTCSGGDSTACVNSFNYTIPKGVKDGNAILAWTWMNTIGNREFYMNCANVDFTGGDGSEMSSFPKMFVANLASLGTCATTEQVNVEFPDPGKYTTKISGSPYKLAIPTAVGCASVSGSVSGSGSGSGGNGVATSSLTAAPTSHAATSISSAAPAPIVTSSAAPVVSSTPVASAPVASGSSSGNNKVSCTTPGQIVCIDVTHFGICDVDNLAVSQPVAAGTQCKGGKIMKRGVAGRETAAERRKHGRYHR
ncbi:hypothetical protein DOTSEDRAFT_53974 [Dothistroma septosporum NZE10]|uniref:Lytic polysaccharide monooxygenase n=1 Tax=Dothistroma septosporum (strain NZE10 / CBS 128990) TaxID=675120 RepID=M2YM09_DOTSN|nr:hypothetical protein DOTSEDRAFT_53974 [Dothistroma septosporum NZE10]